MKRVLFVLFALLLFATPVSATSVIELDLAAMVASSDAIAVATVKNTEGFIDQGRVFTRIELQVDQTWKGELGESVEVVHIGGRKGNLATRVHGMPTFTTGEQVVVFLEKPEKASHFVVTGLSQGKYKLQKSDEGELLVVPQLDASSLVKPMKLPNGSVSLEKSTATRVSAQTSTAPETLEQFHARIDELLKAPANQNETE